MKEKRRLIQVLDCSSIKVFNERSQQMLDEGWSASGNIIVDELAIMQQFQKTDNSHLVSIEEILDQLINCRNIIERLLKSDLFDDNIISSCDVLNQLERANVIIKQYYPT